MLSVDDNSADACVPPCGHIALYTLFNNGAPDDRIALAVVSPTGAQRWSYGRLRKAVLKASGALSTAGLRHGARVMLRLGNTPMFPVAYLGCLSAGVVPMPVSAQLTEKEVARLARVVPPDAVIGAPGNLTCANITEADLTAGPEATVPTAVPTDDPAYILFTSGTDGAAKAVLHAHRAIYARRRMIAGWTGLRATDRVLHAGAMNWSYTLGTGLLDPWSVGATALVLSPESPMDALPLLLKRHEVTVFAGVPGHFRRLLRYDLPTLPALRHAVSAGETLPVEVRAAWRNRTNADVHEAFGQTEISTFISGAPGRPAPDGAIGYAQPGRRVAILDGAAPVERGVPGDIAVGADDPGLMLGYLNGDELTPPTVSDGWYRTGDTGVMLADGAVCYSGRADDILTAGGYRISPLEIENAMRRCPGVEDAAAVDHVAVGGARIVALHFVGTADDEALRTHASEHLAPYKRPRHFVRHDTLPRSANGKLLRARLRTANEGG